jgi:uncharacterized protein (TIGR03437 family)
MALGGTSTAPRLYLANFNAGTIEVYDGNFAPVTLAAGAFTDSHIPAGFAPFNIQNLGGKLYAAYAKQDSTMHYAVAGAGNGYVDVYDMNGVLLQRLAAGGVLNAPWGVQIAPANFGTFANDLLVGNFGDGHINAFDPTSGASLGALQDVSGNTIAISGLWGLQVGNGNQGGDTNAIYFAAGPGSGKHGLFGSLQAAPVMLSSNPVLNGADFQTGISQFSWITVKGSNLSSTTRTWLAKDFQGNQLPTQLDGVSVTVDGKPAYIGYVSPTQINALVAADVTVGPVQVSTGNQGLASGNSSTPMQTTSPAFFITSNNYIAALHLDNVTLVAPPTLYAGAVPAKPGETIELFGTGFGEGNTPIPDGQLNFAPVPVTGVTITVGGTQAQVIFAGVTEPGVYQIDLTIPTTAPDGDAQVVATAGSQLTPIALISVHH